MNDSEEIIRLHVAFGNLSHGIIQRKADLVQEDIGRNTNPK